MDRNLLFNLPKLVLVKLFCFSEQCNLLSCFRPQVTVVTFLDFVIKSGGEKKNSQLFFL